MFHTLCSHCQRSKTSFHHHGGGVLRCLCPWSWTRETALTGDITFTRMIFFIHHDNTLQEHKPHIIYNYLLQLTDMYNRWIRGLLYNRRLVSLHLRTAKNRKKRNRGMCENDRSEEQDYPLLPIGYLCLPGSTRSTVTFMPKKANAPAAPALLGFTNSSLPLKILFISCAAFFWTPPSMCYIAFTPLLTLWLRVSLTGPLWLIASF